MMRQVSYPAMDLTARIELIGQERTGISEEDLDFMAHLLMSLALSRRGEINRARNLIAQAIQRMA